MKVEADVIEGVNAIASGAYNNDALTDDGDEASANPESTLEREIISVCRNRVAQIFKNGNSFDSGEAIKHCRAIKANAFFWDVFSREEIEKAGKIVCADPFIREMPKGYETQVRERGSMLSQGQKQLISFARTLLCDPAILILDEATSSIDVQTEKALQTGLNRMLKGRTSFIIAHRLSTIRGCDKIMYIDDGGIAEAGTHEELMKKKGRYYKLYTAQKSLH